MAIPPYFGPKSGFYRRPALASPTAWATIEARKAAAWRCVMVEMRRLGLRIQPAELLGGPFHPGWIAAEVLHDNPYDLDFYVNEGVTHDVAKLAKAELVKETPALRLYRGWRWEAGQRQQQTWLCGYDEEAVREVLRKMVVER